MTPADEATFIALWTQGLETAAIAVLRVECTPVSSNTSTPSLGAASALIFCTR
jgi:hypothetical protein